MTSCCSEPESHDICSATPACAPPPNAAPDVACVLSHQAFPRRCGGCAARTRKPAPPPRRWDYRIPCPGTNAVSVRLPGWAARRRSLPACPGESCSRARWRPRHAPPAARRRLRPAGCVCSRVCRDLSGWGRHDPPKTRLAQCGVGALPGPIDGSKFVAGFEQFCPDALQHAIGDPALEGAMNRSIVSKLFGQMVPLASAAHLINDAVQRLALVDARPAGVRLGIEFVQGWNNDLVPEFVGTIPDRRQRFHRSFASCHPWLLERGCRRILP